MSSLKRTKFYCFRYFFPTYENDSLLCGLDPGGDIDDTGGDTQTDSGICDTSLVIAEDIPVSDTILQEESVRRDIIMSDRDQWVITGTWWILQGLI